MMAGAVEVAAVGYRSELERKGTAVCPCCRRRGTVYKRKLNSGMARVLIRLYVLHEHTGKKWVHVHEIFGGYGQKHRDWHMLRFWGLVEQQEARNGSEPARGMWRLTPDGRKFANDWITVPKHAYVYEGELVKHSSERTTIREALGERFDYGELMASIGK